MSPQRIKDQISRIDHLDMNSAFIDFLQTDLVVTRAITADSAEFATMSTTSLNAERAEIADLATESLRARSVNATDIDTSTLTADSGFIQDLQSKMVVSAEINTTDLKAKLATIDNLSAGSAFVGYLQALTSATAIATIDQEYVTSIVANNIAVSDLVAQDIVLSDKMRILSKENATQGMIMSGSEIQFLDRNGDVAISIGYNSIIDNETGETTVDYDNPSIIIKDSNGSIMLNSQGLNQEDIGLAPMIQEHSISQGQLSFQFLTGENGEIIVQNFDGSQNTWGRVITEFSSNTITQLNNTVVSVDIYYATSYSNSTAPVNGWSTEVPIPADGQYIWQNTITTYGDGSTDQTGPICIQTPEGKNIVDIETEYCLTLTDDQPDEDDVGWTTQQPDYDADKFLWTRMKITWDNDPNDEDHITYTTPTLLTIFDSLYSDTISVIDDIVEQDQQGHWKIKQGVLEATTIYKDAAQTQPVALKDLASYITTTASGITESVSANTAAITTETNRRKAAYGKCNSAADAYIKVVTCDNFELYAGAMITVDFKNANTVGYSENDDLSLKIVDSQNRVLANPIIIKSFKNENLAQEEYSWDAKAVLDFIYDGVSWRLLDNGMSLKVSHAESRIDMAADQITAMVTVDDETSAITLTQNMVEAMTQQFVVKSPDGQRTIISGGILSTNAIRSNNYVAPTGSANSGNGTYPFSAAGSIFDLSNGEILTPFFALKMASNGVSGNAYLNGVIQTEAGHIGGFTITQNSIYNNMSDIDDDIPESQAIEDEDFNLSSSEPYVLDEDDYLVGGYASRYGIYLGLDGIALGFGRFKVDSSGELYARNATIQGNINATSGQFGLGDGYYEIDTNGLIGYSFITVYCYKMIEILSQTEYDEDSVTITSFSVETLNNTQYSYSDILAMNDVIGIDLKEEDSKLYIVIKTNREIQINSLFDSRIQQIDCGYSYTLNGETTTGFEGVADWSGIGISSSESMELATGTEIGYDYIKTNNLIANGGHIGGLNIEGNYIYGGTRSTYNSGAGYYLGSTGLFGLGNLNNYITFDGTNLVIKGGIIATSLSVADSEVAVDLNLDLDGYATTEDLDAIKTVYVVCNTAANQSEKSLTISDFDDYVNGKTIIVNFTYGNTAAAPTLNINQAVTGKSIKGYTGANLTEAEYTWPAGSSIMFVYDGTNWRIQDSGALTKINTSFTTTATSIESLVANNTTYTKPDGTTAVNTIQSAIKQNERNIQLKVSQDDIIASINASIEQDGNSYLQIQANKINFSGATIFESYSTKDETITEYEILYALSTSSSDFLPVSGTDGIWDTTPPQWRSNAYMWQKTIITYGDGDTDETDPVCIQGAEGQPGTPGAPGNPGTSVTITSIQYAITTTEAQPQDSAFIYDNVPSTIPEGNWLWSLTTYSNGDKLYTKTKQGKSPTVTKSGDTVTITDVNNNTVTISDGASPTVTKQGNVVTITDAEGHVVTIVDDESGTGVAGDNAYFHIAWANSADGQTDFSTSVATNKTYMGTYSDNIQLDSNNPSDYSWVKIKGDSSYTFIRYSENSNGNPMTTTPTSNTLYVGIYTGSLSTAPSSYSSYTWSKYVGEPGDSSYTYIRYSIHSDGNPMTTTPTNDSLYIGIYVGTLATAPSSYNSYVWSRYTGENGISPTVTKSGNTVTITDAEGTTVTVSDGTSPTVSKSGNTVTITDASGHSVTVSDGAQGQSIKGDDGQDAYFHIAWANSANGQTDFSTTISTNKLYMGTYTDHTQQDSNTPSDYTWIKIKGDPGKGLSSVTEYYARNNSTNAPLDSAFDTTVLTPTANEKYVWNYELLTWNDNGTISTDKTPKHIIAVYGEKGNTGKSLVSITEYYKANNDGNTPPGWDSFTTSVDSPTQSNRFLWNYELLTWDDNGTTSTSRTDRHIAGVYGQKGDSAKWFYGTDLVHVTGQATLAASYTTGATVGDMYLNTDTSNIYQCTEIGNNSYNKWVYAGNFTSGLLDNLEIGGTNLLRQYPKNYSSSSYNAYQLFLTENLVANQTYTIQFWNVNVSHTGKTISNLGLSVYWGGGNINLVTMNGADYFNNEGHADYLTATFTVTNSQAQDTTHGASNLWLNIYNSVPSTDGTMSMSIEKWKLERGNIATDWSAAPGDALKEIKQIYCRTNSRQNLPNEPNTIITSTSDSVNYNPSNVNGSWTLTRLPMVDPNNTTYKYTFTCQQLISIDGNLLGNTAILEDAGFVYIDGGNLITNSITSGSFNTDEINISGVFTLGALNSAANTTIENAAKTATNCITEISNTGIWVTPVNYKPASDGRPITTGNNPTVGTKIDNTGVSIYSAGKRMALYGGTTQFFIPGTDNVATEIGSNGLVINEGIISIGQKTSANDVTNNGTYIDVNGNMATSNIKAHGGTIGDWSITSDAITKSGTKTIIFYKLNDNNVVVPESYSSTYTSSLTSGEMRVQSQFTDNDNLIHKFTNLYGNYLHIEESTGTGMFQLSSAVNITSRGMSLYDKNSNYVEISTDGTIKTSTIITTPELWIGDRYWIDETEIGSVLNTDLFLTSNDGTNGCRLTMYGNFRPDSTGGTQYLGTADNRWKQLYCTTAPNVNSDVKTKDNIEEIDFSETLIRNLKPVSFMLKNSDHRRKHMGFIAQDISQLCKDIGENLSIVSASYKDEYEGGREYLGENIDDDLLVWGMTYDELIAPMVLEIQRLMDKVDKLEYELNELKGVK